MTDKAPSAFRTISEAAEELDVPQHVLRFWETRFSQVRPMKRAGGRRYYRPEDIGLLRRIRALLYDEGYTIKGVQKVLRQGARRPDALDPAAPAGELAAESARPEPGPAAEREGAAPALSSDQREELRDIADDLRDLATILKARSRD